MDCICLCYNASAQGGHELLHLQTNRTIIRRNVTPIAIATTPAIIKQVHRLAELEGMPTGLKIQNRTRQILFDSAWIAGVDYNEENFEDKDDPDYEEEDEDDDQDDQDEDNLDREEYYNEANPVDSKDSEGEQDSEEEQEEGVVTDQPDNPDNDESEDSEEEEPEEEILMTEEEPVNQPDIEEDTNIDQQKTRSGRTIRPPERYNLYQNHIEDDQFTKEPYSVETAQVIAKVMFHINKKYGIQEQTKKQFAQTYSLKQDLKKFANQEGHNAALKEMKQLHDRAVFKPTRVSNLTSSEMRKSTESLIFLTEKRDGKIKAWMCANGSVQRNYINKEEAASPTVLIESILLTGVIEAKEKQDVITANIPIAFVQTEIDQNGKKIIMKFRGVLVDIWRLTIMKPTKTM